MSTDAPIPSDPPALDDTTTTTVHDTAADVMDNQIVAVDTASEAVTAVAFIRDGAQPSEVQQVLADLAQEVTARHGGSDE